MPVAGWIEILAIVTCFVGFMKRVCIPSEEVSRWRYIVKACITTIGTIMTIGGIDGIAKFIYSLPQVSNCCIAWVFFTQCEYLALGFIYVGGGSIIIFLIANYIYTGVVANAWWKMALITIFGLSLLIGIMYGLSNIGNKKEEDNEDEHGDIYSIIPKLGGIVSVVGDVTFVIAAAFVGGFSFGNTTLAGGGFFISSFVLGFDDILFHLGKMLACSPKGNEATEINLSSGREAVV